MVVSGFMQISVIILPLTLQINDLNKRFLAKERGFGATISFFANVIIFCIKKKVGAIYMVYALYLNFNLSY